MLLQIVPNTTTLHTNIPSDAKCTFGHKHNTKILTFKFFSSHPSFSKKDKIFFDHLPIIYLTVHFFVNNGPEHVRNWVFSRLSGSKFSFGGVTQCSTELFQTIVWIFWSQIPFSCQILLRSEGIWDSETKRFQQMFKVWEFAISWQVWSSISVELNKEVLRS